MKGSKVVEDAVNRARSIGTLQVWSENDVRNAAMEAEKVIKEIHNTEVTRLEEIIASKEVEITRLRDEVDALKAIAVEAKESPIEVDVKEIAEVVSQVELGD